MDEQQRELLRQRLEAERQKLTDEQRQDHDRFCARLKQEKTYADEHAVKAAHIIRTEDVRRQASELQNLERQADRAARERRERARVEAERHNEYLADRAEQRRAADTERSKQRETREQAARDAQNVAAQEARRNEPIPGTMQRFNAILLERKAQTNAAGIERATELSQTRPSYARYDVMKSAQAQASDKWPGRSESRGEISDAKAERLARMFDKPAPGTGFDPTDDHTNKRGPRGGGRGSR